jgi:hypothetical protein
MLPGFKVDAAPSFVKRWLLSCPSLHKALGLLNQFCLYVWKTVSQLMTAF